MENLDARGTMGDTGTAYRWVGKVGYIAKGIAFMVIGGLFVAAGVTHDPQKSGGLDDALRTVVQQPFGPFLLILIAVGIACYGFFCFARARHLSK
jgi:type IV secretory pathway VirB2 component (pilin)